VVLGLSNSLVWRCPTRRILQLYDRHISVSHLDVGVGTGWYLDHCHFPSAAPRVGLMDLNKSSLAAASHRVVRYQPEQYQVDVLQPVPLGIPPFHSIGLSYLLHCLPGDLESKSVVFDNLAPVLAPGGVIFGATLLSIGVERSGSARGLMRAYNRRGIFSNEDDSVAALRTALERRFRKVDLDVVGCAALFAASN